MEEDKMLFASDLDGTLLRNDRQISKDTHDTINTLLKEGHTVVVATARTFEELPQSVLDTNIEYFICTNGAAIYKRGQKDPLVRYTIDKEDCFDIVETTKDVEKAITITSDQTVYSEKSIQKLFISYDIPDHVIESLKRDRTLVDDIRDIKDEINVIDKLHYNFEDKEKRDACLDLLKKHDTVSITSSHFSNIEITNLEATKGKALEYIRSLLNIDPKETYFFGDNDNDLAGFEYSEHKIAMKNATERLKAASTEITQFDNDGDGVANYLKQFI